MSVTLRELRRDGGVRTVIELNGNGTPAVSFDPQLLKEYDIDFGDPVGVRVDRSGEQHVLEVMLGEPE